MLRVLVVLIASAAAAAALQATAVANETVAGLLVACDDASTTACDAGCASALELRPDAREAWGVASALQAAAYGHVVVQGSEPGTVAAAPGVLVPACSTLGATGCVLLHLNYHLVALNASGDVCATTSVPASAVANVSVRGVRSSLSNQTTLELTWSPPAGLPDGEHLQRVDVLVAEMGVWPMRVHRAVSVPVNATQWTLADLPPNTHLEVHIDTRTERFFGHQVITIYTQTYG